MEREAKPESRQPAWRRDTIEMPFDHDEVEAAENSARDEPRKQLRLCTLHVQLEKAQRLSTLATIGLSAIAIGIGWRAGWQTCRQHGSEIESRHCRSERIGRIGP